MRYLINDDDIENWITILKLIEDNYNSVSLRYVIQQMEAEVNYNLDKINETN